MLASVPSVRQISLPTVPLSAAKYLHPPNETNSVLCPARKALLSEPSLMSFSTPTDADSSARDSSGSMATDRDRLAVRRLDKFPTKLRINSRIDIVASESRGRNVRCGLAEESKRSPKTNDAVSRYIETGFRMILRTTPAICPANPPPRNTRARIDHIGFMQTRPVCCSGKGFNARAYGDR